MLLDDEQQRPAAGRGTAGGGSGVASNVRLAEYSLSLSFAMARILADRQDADNG